MEQYTERMRSYAESPEYAEKRRKLEGLTTGAGNYIKTPEAIREGIDRRRANETPLVPSVDPVETYVAEERIPASDPVHRAGPPKTVARKQPIMVTVSGARLAGKTTLIAIIAQALENAGHLVKTPRGTPNASAAVSTIFEQFDVTFVEGDDDVEAVGHAAHREQIKVLTAENKALQARLAQQISPEEAARLIDQAVEHLRSAAVIENHRHEIKRAIDAKRSESVKLQHESAAREHEARSMLAKALGVSVPHRLTIPARTDPFTRASGAWLSAEDQDADAQARSQSRHNLATDRLTAANLAAMAGDDQANFRA